MIYTVTCNPAVDKTGYLDKINIHHVNRLVKVESDAGGRGVNLARTLKMLDIPAIATGFLGGSSGNFIRILLQREDIQYHMVDIIGNTRSNLKIMDGEELCTEINEEGPFVLQNEVDELNDYLREHLDERSICVISGSVPRGVSKSLYPNMVNIAKENGALVVLDVPHHLMHNCMHLHPEIVRIKMYALAQYMGKEWLEDDEILDAGKQFLNEGCDMLVVTGTKKGIYIITRSVCYHCDMENVKVVNYVGATDAFLAGLICGLETGLHDKELIELAGACCAACVSSNTSHPMSSYQIETMKQNVKITVL